MNGGILFVVGLTLLIVGAELVVRGGSRLAKSLGVRPLVIGLTVVSVGTSAPELAIGITASMQDRGALAVGNIAGTNVFNILFILGLSALLRPLSLHLQTIKLDLPMIIGAATLMSVLAWDGVLGRLDGILMCAVAVLYTAALIRIARHESRTVKAEFREMYGVDDITTKWAAPRLRTVSALLLALGMALTVYGADLLVDGTVDIAKTLGFSDALIGLTILAVGTSAPELVTTIVATLKDDRDVAVGNLLGSSIYNILVILGLTSMVPAGGIPVERQLLLFDIPLMLGVALACVPVFMTGSRVSRIEGGIFVTVYLTYLGWLILFHS